MNQVNSLSALLSVIAFILMFPIRAQADLRELTFYTEVYPPANYMEDDIITGYAVDILLEASALVGEPISREQLVLQPWAHSYHTTLTEPGTAIFSTTRSHHREKLFKWVGPIIDVNIVVLAKKEANIKIAQPMDLADYRIGVIRDDIGEQLLLSEGVPRASMQEAEYVTVLVEQLRKNRIDLLVYSERSTLWWSKKANVDPLLFEPVYQLQESSIYFAFNKDTPTAYIEKLQKGLDMLKQNHSNSKSRYEQILEKY